LLGEDHETMYWIGMLFADGHFSDLGRIILQLNDADRVKMFSVFIGNAPITIRKKWARTCIQHSSIVSKIKEKYNISHQKTYNPVSTSHCSVEQIASILIGFIDGDGCIQNRVDSGFKGTIKCHASWLPVFIEWRRRLSGLMDIGGKPKLNSRGYAEWHLSATQLRQLKDHTNIHNLPVMKRKWDIVVTKQIFKLTPEIIEYIKKSDKGSCALAKETNIGRTTIWKVKSGKISSGNC
jgi:hypothetical protein